MPSRILLQLDTDLHPSSFDSVVAIDSGVDHLLQYGNVQAESVTSLVHGAMFTRGGEDLSQTAIFIGGSNVHAAEDLLKSVSKVFFGPVRVSVMLDANGCNTTAAAAVVAASRHISLRNATASMRLPSVALRVQRGCPKPKPRSRISRRPPPRSGGTCRRLRCRGET